MIGKPIQRLGLLVAFVWFSWPQLGWSFGRDGHSIVGKIAELRLNDKAIEALAELTDRSLADVPLSSWADTITHQNVFPLNAFWHFVDVPYEATEFNPEREAEVVAKRVGKTVKEIGTENNVIDKIEYWRRVLADKKASRYQRYTALRFVVHFVGDIHQPLHCIARNHDAGGNAVPVTFLGTFDSHVKLHQVWDTSLVNLARGKVPLELYANKLNKRTSDQDEMDWEAHFAPGTWAKESHELAKKFVYPPVIEQEWDKHKDVPVKLDMDYANKALPVVEMQLMKAGVRLAKALNDALAP